MRLQTSPASTLTVLMLTLTASVAACGSDDPAPVGRPDGVGGDESEAPGVAGGASESSGGAGVDAGGAGGVGAVDAGGNGGEREAPLPRFEPYEFDVVLADYYGDRGLFRLTLSDAGASEAEPLFVVGEGERTLSHRPHRDGVLLTLQDDTYGHLFWQPLSGGAATRVSHELAEHEIVEKWATAGDTVYYGVGTFMGNSHTYAAALWKAAPSDDGYTQTQVALPEPVQGRSLYDLWAIGDWLYMPGFVSNSGSGYQFHRAAPPDDTFEPVGLTDYEFTLHQAESVLTYRGTSEAGGIGVYAANLHQATPNGTRLSPDNQPLGNNPQLHGASEHYFFSTKATGEGEKGYFADLSKAPFRVVPLLQSQDPEALLFGAWSESGRYFYLHEGSPSVDVTTYVIDVTEEQPKPRLAAKQLSKSWLSSSPDSRFFSMTQPELWIMKPDDADFALRVDDGLELDGATVAMSTFSDDAHHIWFALSDGRCFVDDTLARTAPRPVDVTPELPEGFRTRHATRVAFGGFLLAASTDDEQAKAAHEDQALFYVRRLPSGEYAPAERLEIAGMRWLMNVD